ncbi:HD domain-containing phosphohydrolase [Marinobacterium jannaschii]|uniref:HD domain-containing phosphohydrolase n=1 Tax=Marinobacterium jannaschii TaxID=64970 RepID=UPI00048670E2|nr:HD domain-containing phosphohydrolase [Marinobacterium jannaschii]
MEATSTAQTSQPTPQAAILCVDDEHSILSALRRLLRGAGHKVVIAQGGHAGLEALADNSDIAVVISDMRMPEMSGAEFLQQVAEMYPQTCRFLLTGYADMESTVQAINQGRIEHYINKPWDNQDLLLKVDKAFSLMKLRSENERLNSLTQKQNAQLQEMNKGLEEKVRLRTEQIQLAHSKLKRTASRINESYRASIRTFYNLISLNPYLGGKRTQMIADTAAKLATQLKLDKELTQHCYLTGMLHELGMLGLPEELLCKQRNSLSETERQQFYSHPLAARTALTPVDTLVPVANAIAMQYARFDGQNATAEQPQGQKIPAAARIISPIRDLVNYMEGIQQEERLSAAGAYEVIAAGAGTLYDPAVINALKPLLDSLNSENSLHANEKMLGSHQLEPGMQLSRNLFNQNEIMLLPQGSLLSEAIISRLRTIDEVEEEVAMQVFVFAAEEAAAV